MGKNVTKKILSGLLTLIMVFSLFWGVGTMEVQAAEEKIKPAFDISFDYNNFGAIDANSTYRDILNDIGENLEWEVSPTPDESKTGIAFLIDGDTYEAYFDDDNNNTELLDSKVDDDAIVKIEICVNFDKEIDVSKPSEMMSFKLNGEDTAFGTYNYLDGHDGWSDALASSEKIAVEYLDQDGDKFDNFDCAYVYVSLGSIADIKDEIENSTKDSQPAPTSLTDGKGKINGTTTKMEYSSDDGTTWKDCTEGSTTVAPGTYKVRLKADDTHKAGEAATVTVTEATPQDTPKESDKKTETKIETGTPVGSVAGLEKAYETLATENNKGYTAADKAIVAAGGSANIYLDAKVVTKETKGSKAASDKLTSAGYKTGLALDINIFKDITTSAGVKTTTQLIELPSVIDVTVDIPANLQGKAEYSVYRNHEGSVDILTTTKNADGEYIEVSKDGKKLTLHIKKFSEYVLGYKEATASSAVAPKTGDDTPIALYILLSLIGCGFILTAKRRLKRA